MKYFIIWISVIILGLGTLYYITEGQSEIDIDQYKTEDEVSQQRDYSEEYKAFGRKYDEPIIAISATGMAQQYRTNAVRLEAKFDGNLVRITGVPSNIQSTDDGGASMNLSGFPLYPDAIVFTSGGAKFKADAANVKNNYDRITLLCYLDGGYLDTPVLVDCIFDYAGMEAIKREEKLEAQLRQQEYQRQQEAEYQEAQLRQQEYERQQEAENTAYQKQLAQEAQARKKQEAQYAKEEAEREKRYERGEKEKADKLRNDQAKNDENNRKIRQGISDQSYSESDPYNTTYANKYGEVEERYFD